MSAVASTLEALHALITGGGRGIGRAIAQSLAGSGARVTVVSRSQSQLDQTVRRIQVEGGDADAITADLSDAIAAERVVESVWARRGPIDVLVHCAGFTPSIAPLQATSWEDYQRTMAVNVGALFQMARWLVPRLQQRPRGLVIAMSSGCGLKGHPGMAAYSASKFAVQGLIQALARELEGTSVRAVAVNPGGVNTRMLADLFGAEESAKNQSPEVIADVVKKVVAGEITVPSGGGVAVRHGLVEVYEMPARKSPA
jgi:3-oxoacyl-[acyl-carrier protein] reductase